MAEVASAYVSLMFSAQGSQAQIAREVGGAGKSGGTAAAKGFKGAFLPGLKSLAGPVAGLIGIGAGIKFFKDANAEAREAQKVGALTTQVIKTTGGAAKVTASHVGNLATAISNKTGIDDEAIQSSENLLLTFKNVRNELGKGNAVFDRATGAAADLSAAGFGDLSGTSKQLGKALNDPVKGMSALNRVGVQFSEEQTKQVKNFVKHGEVLKAQKIILGEVESQVGGAAAASATAGEKATVAFGNLKEQVGTAMLPVIDELASTFTEDVVPAISEFISGMGDGTGAGGKFADILGGVKGVLAAIAPVVVTVFGFLVDNKEAVGAFAGVLLSVAAAVKVWAIAQAILNVALTANPIGLVVVAIALLVGGLVMAWKKSETFRDIVTGAFEAIGAAATWLWDKAIKPVITFILNGYGMVFTAIGKVLDALGNIPGFGWAKDAADKMFNAAAGARKMAEDMNKIKDKSVTITFNAVELDSEGNRTNKRLFGPPRAHGGPVRAGTTYPVGENGVELFTAQRNGFIIPNGGIGSGDLTSGGTAAPISLHGVLSIDRDGVAYIDGRARRAVDGERSAASERTRARAGGGVDF